jgi:hypothetical protein
MPDVQVSLNDCILLFYGTVLYYELLPVSKPRGALSGAARSIDENEIERIYSTWLGCDRLILALILNNDALPFFLVCLLLLFLAETK